MSLPPPPDDGSREMDAASALSSLAAGSRMMAPDLSSISIVTQPLEPQRPSSSFAQHQAIISEQNSPARLRSSNRINVELLPQPEAEKILERRSRNKEAAARCRQRRVELENDLKSMVSSIELKNSNLETECQHLSEQKRKLEFTLRAHEEICQKSVSSLQLPAKSEPAVPAPSTTDHTNASTHLLFAPTEPPSSPPHLTAPTVAAGISGGTMLPDLLRDNNNNASPVVAIEPSPSGGQAQNQQQTLDDGQNASSTSKRPASLTIKAEAEDDESKRPCTLRLGGQQFIPMVLSPSTSGGNPVLTPLLLPQIAFAGLLDGSTGLTPITGIPSSPFLLSTPTRADEKKSEVYTSL